MIFFAWANQDSNKLRQIKDTAKLYGIDLVFIGMGSEVGSDLSFNFFPYMKQCAN